MIIIAQANFIIPGPRIFGTMCLKEDRSGMSFSCVFCYHNNDQFGLSRSDCHEICWENLADYKAPTKVEVKNNAANVLEFRMRIFLEEVVGVGL